MEGLICHYNKKLQPPLTNSSQNANFLGGFTLCHPPVDFTDRELRARGLSLQKMNSRHNNISNLTDPEFLSEITGPVKSLIKTPFTAIGFSGSTLDRVEVLLESGIKRSFILKCTQIKTDWLSQRANDHVGREAELPSEPCLAGVWKSIQSPYVAFARENGRVALLMDDLSDHLFPDIRESIDLKSEDIILNSLGSLHASFWESSEIKNLQWLTTPYNYLEVFSSCEHESDKYAPPPLTIGNNIRSGWNIAWELLSPKMKNIITKPAKELFDPFKKLPVTLLHGDAKIGNMAILPPGRLAMFDWTYVGRGPCGMELGWYLAVNATRLVRSREDLIKKYRSCLESYLNFALPEKTWSMMVDLAILTGARMMLWNKALGYHGGTQRGKDEWDWWISQLNGIRIFE